MEPVSSPTCCSRWRLWIRPLVMSLYLVIVIIIIPLIVAEMMSQGYEKKQVVWLIGGIFTFMAVPVSLWDIVQHLVHYTKPHLQKYIIRILWMVPIYALNAWLGMTFPNYSIYMDTCRECYEAYVIYNFMMFLLTFLRTEMNLEEGEAFGEEEYINHIFPLCCIKPWPIGRSLIHRCKHGILQYTVIRPVTTIISLICEVADVYREGEFRADAAYPYMVAINNASQFVAMYSLVLFYRAYKNELNPMRPIGKFLCIKAVVFFSFFQGVIIAILVFTKVIPESPDSSLGLDTKHVAQGIQNFLICIEMFLAAIAHHFSFSYRPYVNLSQEDRNCCIAFLHMWDVSDVRRDFAEHIRVVRSTVRRTVIRKNAYSTIHGNEDEASNEKQSLINATTSSSRPTNPVGKTYQALSDKGSGSQLTVQAQIECVCSVEAGFVDLTDDSATA